MESREREGAASELLDLLGGVRQIPNAKVLLKRTEPASANAAYRRGRRASPPDQRPARNHDRPAVVTHVAHIPESYVRH